MSLFAKFGISHVRHYAPLHYLPFIARSALLLSKPSLTAHGFGQSHLRAKSHEQDVKRGFGDCAFLTLDHKARILKAKLEGGFPHIGIAVPAKSVEATDYSLCRYNVAMTRQLRRDGKSGFEESSSNGRYYDGRQIPIARSAAEKNALLKAHFGTDTMIEVLIHGDLPLPNETSIICFCDEDALIAEEIISKLGSPWTLKMEQPPTTYRRKDSYGRSVSEFIARSVSDPDWRGNGLDFDRV
jgi:hypothetical protein